MATKKEIRKENRNKIVKLTEELGNKISQSIFIVDEQFKQELLFSVAEILELCQAQSEAIRFAEMVACWNLSAEKDILFKALLRKQLDKILN